MPNAPSGGALTLRTQKGIEFPAAFNKGFCELVLPGYAVLWLAGESN
ncbi:hypothetical protein H6G33_36650 [Calothrix sp. FACHB-1219]|nr:MULTISPECIES: hypothetical protein [unclassified Calothrix]MBD2207881.1 hypothetical protein [Calothrix sp. FACHB-168]MBD2222463.1 hypothetical protein [Calothrix sp. FACHB-1219]